VSTVGPGTINFDHADLNEAECYQMELFSADPITAWEKQERARRCCYPVSWMPTGSQYTYTFTSTTNVMAISSVMLGYQG
jgi:hypothetical protein